MNLQIKKRTLLDAAASDLGKKPTEMDDVIISEICVYHPFSDNFVLSPQFSRDQQARNPKFSLLHCIHRHTLTNIYDLFQTSFL